MLMGFIKAIASLLIIAAASAIFGFFFGFTAAICYSSAMYAFTFWSF